MCKKYGIRIAVFILLFLGISFGQDIRVENVLVPQDSVKLFLKIDRYLETFSQSYNRDLFSGVVYYDLINDGSQDTLAVWLEMSINGGTIWHKGNIWCDGDCGRVVKGKGKKAYWTWFGYTPEIWMWLNDNKGDNFCRIKVVAKDELSQFPNEPPQPPGLLSFDYKLIEVWGNLYEYIISFEWMPSPSSSVCEYRILCNITGNGDSAYTHSIFIDSNKCIIDTVFLFEDTVKTNVRPLSSVISGSIEAVDYYGQVSSRSTIDVQLIRGSTEDILYKSKRGK